MEIRHRPAKNQRLCRGLGLLRLCGGFRGAVGQRIISRSGRFRRGFCRSGNGFGLWCYGFRLGPQGAGTAAQRNQHTAKG